MIAYIVEVKRSGGISVVGEGDPFGPLPRLYWSQRLKQRYLDTYSSQIESDSQLVAIAFPDANHTNSNKGIDVVAYNPGKDCEEKIGKRQRARILGYVKNLRKHSS